MPEYGADQVRCAVYTRREGVLSPVGHDLKLEVGSLSLSVDAEAGEVRARFDPASLSVAGAVDGQRVAAVGGRDRKKIEKRLRDEVLETGRHPKIAFEGRAEPLEDGAWSVAGELSLHGRTRRVEATASPEGDELVARVAIHTPDYGIAPVKALMGALRVHPEVVVEIAVPRAAAFDRGAADG